MRTIIIFAVLLLAGCARDMTWVQPSSPVGPTSVPQAPAQPSAPLDEAAMQAAMAHGHGIIQGQAFSKTRGGDVKYGAGNVIQVFPDSPYVEECIHLIAGMAYPKCNSVLQAYARNVTADGEGRFVVENLPPGKYFLITSITWEVPSMYGLERSGGPVTAVAEIKSDTDVVTAYLQ